VSQIQQGLAEKEILHLEMKRAETDIQPRRRKEQKDCTQPAYGINGSGQMNLRETSMVGKGVSSAKFKVRLWMQVRQTWQGTRP
jgi:hypothetical protein